MKRLIFAFLLLLSFSSCAKPVLVISLTDYIGLIIIGVLLIGLILLYLISGVVEWIKTLKGGKSKNHF